eukprot:351934-Chlamydomonas_euryale.AAC.12
MNEWWRVSIAHEWWHDSNAYGCWHDSNAYECWHVSTAYGEEAGGAHMPLHIVCHRTQCAHLKLQKGRFDHLAGVNRRAMSQQVEHHVVTKPKPALKRVRAAQQTGTRLVCHNLHTAIQQYHNQATVVDASATGTSGHLDVLTRGQHPPARPIKFVQPREHNGLGRHVQPSTKCLSSENLHAT